MSQPTGVCKSVRYISLCGALHSVLAGAFSSEGVCKSVRYISLLVCNTVAALYLDLQTRNPVKGDTCDQIINIPNESQEC